ncbi:MAG: 2-C-methyl-D-erythritol 4-phosphate cytidylyltransferase, partial [Verrucomicrobiota bacterium]
PSHPKKPQPLMTQCSAILLAAGSSRRLGFDKILTPLAGKPAFLYALKVLVASDAIHELVVVTREDLIVELESLIEKEKPSIPFKVIAGGKERQDSVYAGLQEADNVSEMVLIHDAARPLISDDLIHKVLEVACKTGAAICGRPAADTLKQTQDQATIQETLDRSKIWQVETPQVFKRELALEAYRNVIENDRAITDDASAVEALGHVVSLVESTDLNLKITRSADWEILKVWMGNAQGKSLRNDLHKVNNSLMPLTGFLPFLEKYRDNDQKFRKYISQIQSGSREAIEAIQRAQVAARELFPD